MTKSDALRRKRQVDMSPEAIARRLREVGELYKLGMALKNARRLGKVEELRKAKDQKPK